MVITISPLSKIATNYPVAGDYHIAVRPALDPSTSGLLDALPYRYAQTENSGCYMTSSGTKVGEHKERVAEHGGDAELFLDLSQQVFLSHVHSP